MRITEIRGAFNYYGGVHVIEYNDKYYWGIKCYWWSDSWIGDISNGDKSLVEEIVCELQLDSSDSEISKELYDQLIKHNELKQ